MFHVCFCCNHLLCVPNIHVSYELSFNVDARGSPGGLRRGISHPLAEDRGSRSGPGAPLTWPSPLGAAGAWLRTDGVDTNGPAAKVKTFDRLGKTVRPGIFGKI